MRVRELESAGVHAKEMRDNAVGVLVVVLVVELVAMEQVRERYLFACIEVGAVVVQEDVSSLDVVRVTVVELSWMVRSSHKLESNAFGARRIHWQSVAMEIDPIVALEESFDDDFLAVPGIVKTVSVVRMKAWVQELAAAAA